MRVIAALLVLFAPAVLGQACSEIYPPALCQGIVGNAFVSSHRGCQNWVQCIGGNVANCGLCMGYLHFDPLGQTCTYPEIAQCETTSNVTCTPGEVSREPHPTNCNLYYLCTGNPDQSPIQQSCADNLHFDPILRKCNFPELANCEVVEPPPPPPGGVQCPDVDGVVLVPDDTSCDNFYICFNRQPTRHTCPATYHFCRDHRFCLPIGQAVCILPSSPVQRIFELKPLSNFECPYTGMHYLPYSGNCQRYVLCIDGHAYEQSCADGLYFNPTTLRCEPQDNVACAY